MIYFFLFLSLVIYTFYLEYQNKKVRIKKQNLEKRRRYLKSIYNFEKSIKSYENNLHKIIDTEKNKEYIENWEKEIIKYKDSLAQEKEKYKKLYYKQNV